jgi:tetratricopeptide (TPR) repeat protein
MDTSNGPASPAEAALLWKDGQTAFDNGNYQEALNQLQRLVDRYPGSEGYLEAHRLLGRTLMMLGKYQEALNPLQFYVDAVGNRALGLRTQLWLGEDKLTLGKAYEAYLLSTEVEKGSIHSAPELHAESQFLKARSLMALDHDDRALKVLDSVEAAPAVRSDPTLKAHAAFTRIILKLKSCARLPSKEAMDESQAREQFGRRAVCLQEALALFRDTTESHELQTGEDAGDKIYQGFVAYSLAVQHPPAPPKMKPTDRTAAQKKSYFSELSDRLTQDFKKAVRDSLATLQDWKSKDSSNVSGNKSVGAENAYGKLSKKIETLL